MTLDDLSIGQTAELKCPVTNEAIRSFADLSGDRNPVHLDEEFARASRFKGRIAHGMLVASFVSSAIANELPGPGAIYMSQSLRFMAPVRPGDVVLVRLKILDLVPEKRRVVLSTTCWVEDDQVIDGEAMLYVP